MDYKGMIFLLMQISILALRLKGPQTEKKI